jgi:hypothetical protein
MAELFLTRPLFRGSSEIDQLSKIASVFGIKHFNDWKEGSDLLQRNGLTLNASQTLSLDEILKGASYPFLELIKSCL